MIENKIKEIVISVLKIDPSVYNDELAVGDITEWDSVNHVKLIQQIEDDFDINIDVIDAIDIEDIWDIVNTVKKYIGDST